VDRALSEDEDEPPSSKKRQRTKTISTPPKNDGKGFQTKTPDPEASDVAMVENSPEGSKGPASEHGGEAEEKTAVDSESEMSNVLDVTPKKKRQRTAGTSKPRATSKAAITKTPAKGRAKKPKEATPADADTVKLKELQGWLAKCGVSFWEASLLSGHLADFQRFADCGVKSWLSSHPLKKRSIT